MLAWLATHARDYDVIHLLFTPTRLNSRILKFLLPKSAHIIQTIATIRTDLYSANEYRNVFFADTLITYSLFAKNILTKSGFTNVTQIYPGINLEKYHPTERNAELASQWKIEKDDYIVSYPGEFARLGATDIIVDAFLELWSNPANAHIKYFCACRIKGPEDAIKKNEVYDRFRKAGHINKVIFSDTFSGNMNDIYNMADIVIFPVVTMRGKFDVPLAMVEPYACKKVVIASDLPIFHEFSTDDINVIIPRNSSTHIADAITSIERDHSQHTQRKENAFSFIHKHFNITEIGTRYSDVYTHISNKS